MKSNNLLKPYSVILTIVAIGLWIETKNLEVQLDEEIELKYENSAIIDSLLNEQKYLNETQRAN